MTRTVIMLGSVVLVVMIAAVTLLIALGKDPSTLIAFMTAAIVPTAVSLFGVQKAGRAAEAAEKTVTQTNGRMTELIANNEKLASQVVALSGGKVLPVDSATDERVDSDVEG